MSENNLLSKLSGLHEKFENLSQQIADPAVMSDMKKYVQLNKEYKELAPIVKAGDKFRKLTEDLEAAKDILQNEKDEELREMAKEEISSIEAVLPQMEEEIKLLLIPADPQDAKNAIVEIRGGAGGDEASIFAGDLFRMYVKFIERKGWRLPASPKVRPEDLRRLFSKFPEKGYMGFSSMRAGCIACSVSRRRKHRGACIRRRLR